MEIKFPIDATTKEGDEAIRFLLREGFSTIELLADAIDDMKVVEGCLIHEDAPWIVHDPDGGREEYDPDIYDPEDAAKDFISGGDWGDCRGSVECKVWREAIDSDGDSRDVEEQSFYIDLFQFFDHAAAIHEVMGRSGCGDDPDVHDWTAKGEGGCEENPGVWFGNGTTLVFQAHCRRCGLHRTETKLGSQRNPGDGDSVEYRQLDEEEIESHRKHGTMDSEE